MGYPVQNFAPTIDTASAACKKYWAVPCDFAALTLIAHLQSKARSTPSSRTPPTTRESASRTHSALPRVVVRHTGSRGSTSLPPSSPKPPTSDRPNRPSLFPTAPTSLLSPSTRHLLSLRSSLPRLPSTVSSLVVSRLADPVVSAETDSLAPRRPRKLLGRVEHQRRGSWSHLHAHLAQPLHHHRHRPLRSPQPQRCASLLLILSDSSADLLVQTG